MPLPKSSSIAAKATEVYSEVWSVILRQIWSMPPSRDDDVSEISCLLPYLRQLLTCCACAGLLEDAMISLSCGHCYCCECQFRDPLLKIQCRQCRERTGLVIENQLRLLVKCYRHMCSILAARIKESPELLKQLSNQRSDDSNAVTTSSPTIDNLDTLSKSDDKQSNKNTKCKASKNEKKAPPVPDPNFNPIPEILREILEGVKVSRAVLIIKPPAKYLNAKLTVTPKKEQLVSSTVTGPRPTPKCASNLTSQLSTIEPVDETSTPELHLPISSVRSRGRKRNSRKSFGSRRQSSYGEQSPLLVKKRHSDSGQESEKVVERNGTSTEEEEVDILSVNEVSSQRATEKELIERKFELDCFQSDVSLSCLDEQYLDVSSNSVTLKTDKYDNFEGSAPVDESQLRFRMSADGNRERLWSHLSPKVHVKRSRATIDRMHNQQLKIARSMAKTHSKILAKTPEMCPPQVSQTQQSDERILAAEFEETLPKDITEILEELESENPYPIDRSFYSPPIFPPPFCPMPPHPSVCEPPMFASLHQQTNYNLMVNPVPLKIPYSPQMGKTPPPSKKRRTPGYSEEGWRCRCGTNNVMFPEKVCAKGKCPCFSKGIPCKNCLCRQCHNPNNQ